MQAPPRHARPSPYPHSRASTLVVQLLHPLDAVVLPLLRSACWGPCAPLRKHVHEWVFQDSVTRLLQSLYIVTFLGIDKEMRVIRGAPNGQGLHLLYGLNSCMNLHIRWTFCGTMFLSTALRFLTLHDNDRSKRIMRDSALALSASIK